jgi:hypothetical protein
VSGTLPLPLRIFRSSLVYRLFVNLSHFAEQSSTVKAQGKKDAMATFQHINGVMEDFEANKVLEMLVLSIFLVDPLMIST